MNGKRAKKKRPVSKLFWKYIITFALFFSPGLIFVLVWPKLSSVWLLTVLSVLGILIEVVSNIVSKNKKSGDENTQPQGEEQERGEEWFFQKRIVIIILCAILAGLILLVIAQEREKRTESNEPEKPVTESAQNAQNTPRVSEPEDGDTEEPKAPEEPEPRFSIPEWEEDPCLKKLDTYCGEHVEEERHPEKVEQVLTIGIQAIEYDAPQSKEALEGPGSKFGEYVADANDYYDIYRYIAENKRRFIEDQIIYLKKSLDARVSADDYYEDESNRKIVADYHMKLAGLCKVEGNLDGEQEHYLLAFEWYQKAYRTAVAHGRSRDVRKGYIDNIADAAEHMRLVELNSKEKEMAPDIARAYERLWEKGIA